MFSDDKNSSVLSDVDDNKNEHQEGNSIKDDSAPPSLIKVISHLFNSNDNMLSMIAFGILLILLVICRAMMEKDYRSAAGWQ